MKILVTGGAGYIGSHTALELLKQGQHVAVLDNLEKGHQNVVEVLAEQGGDYFSFIKADLRDLAALRSELADVDIDATIHFAAYLEVGLSTQKPELFFENNVVGSQNLFQVLIEKDSKDIVFSSSAAVYGTQETVPIPESAAKHPDSPYGETKYIMERILESYTNFKGMNAIALRYFNPAGAVEGLPGERHIPETHLIPLLLHAYLSDDFQFKINGDDYPTQDGTAIRDFIHIQDLVNAHILSLEYLKHNPGFHAFNVGTGAGSSIKDVITTAEEVVGRELAYEVGPRRVGDPAELVADPNLIQTRIGWKAEYSLKDIIKSAWEWEQRRDIQDYA